MGDKTVFARPGHILSSVSYKNKCEPILESQSLCRIEMVGITQSIVTSAKELQKFQI